MLKFSTTTPFYKGDSPEALLAVKPLIRPDKSSTLKSGDLKGKAAYIINKALELAGFYLPCFFDGDITELDKPNPEVIMVLPSGCYMIDVQLDVHGNNLLDLK